MSGGIDSSTAAYLLKKAGFEVIGITMKLWRENGKCCNVNEYEDARNVAQKLSIPHYSFNLVKEFEQEVVEYFCQEYAHARTPNPCIICNEKIKFGVLLDKAKKLDAPYIATGHYANVEYNNCTNRYNLKKGKDTKKDQSYFLFSLSQAQLSCINFPLSNLTKSEVHRIAISARLPVRQKKESQEICFVTEKNYNEFLKKRGFDYFKPGLIKDKNGRIVGRHPGIHFFTIGQRKGIGGGRKKPFYVIEIKKEENSIVVGEKKEVYATSMQIGKVNWVSIPEPDHTFPAMVKIRYQHPESPAAVFPLHDKKCRIDFLSPQWAITPGQAAVFYEKDTLLGGGWIEKPTNDEA